MSWPNDSVILLESPKKNEGKFTKQTVKKQKIKRSPLKAARRRQMSPGRGLARQKSQKIIKEHVLGIKSSAIPMRNKSFTNNSTQNEAEITLRTTGKRKKMKKSELSEEVIVLSDDEDCQVLINEPVNSRFTPKNPIVTKDTSRLNAKRRRIILPRQCKNRPRRKKQQLTMPYDETDELKVLWTSNEIPQSFQDPPEKSEIDATNNSENDSFFVDTDGDQSLLLLDILDATIEKQTKNRWKRKKFNEPKVPESQDKRQEVVENKKLREIIVDGCNVAMCFSNHNKFDVKGLQLVLDYFTKKGHKVKIFLPQHERRRGRVLLDEWNKQGLLIFTPSKKIGNKKITPYDDRFILEYANKCQGIVISSDHYRDLWDEKPEWRETIEQRVLQPTFVGDYVMFPEDPLGRSGPSLEAYLRH